MRSPPRWWCPVREAGRLGGEQRGGDIHDPLRVQSQHIAVGQVQAVHGDLGVPSDHVVAGQVRDVDPITRDDDERRLAVVVGREQEHIGDLAAEHDTRGAREGDGVALSHDSHVPRLQGHRTEQRSVRESVEFGTTPRLVQDRRDDHGRKERAGHHRSPEFLGDDRGSEQAESGTSHLFR